MTSPEVNSTGNWTDSMHPWIGTTIRCSGHIVCAGIKLDRSELKMTRWVLPSSHLLLHRRIDKTFARKYSKKVQAAS